MIKAFWLAGTTISVAFIGTASAQMTPAAPAPIVGAVDQADTAGTDIVVTASRREERLQDVPIAVSALSAAQIQNQRINTALDLNNVAPALRITAADAAANPKIYIRGIGLSDFNPSSSSSVGIYVDGVYINSPIAQLAGFYDIGRIEVLRGPQGTLFGRNTTGGAINIVTNRPSQTFEGSASVDYAEYNTVNANAALGGPIIADRLAFRVSGQLVRDDGYTYNRTTGHDIGAADRYAVRGQLMYTPAPNVEFLAQGSIFRNRGDSVVIKQRPLIPGTAAATGADGQCAAGSYRSGACTDVLGYADTNSDPFSVESNLEGKDRIDVNSGSITATVGLGGMDVIMVTAYQDAKRDDVENTDGGADRLIEAQYKSLQRTFSQEVRFQSHGKQAFRWLVGGFYLRDYLRDDSSYDILRDARALFTSPDNPTGVSLENSVAQFNWPYTQKTDSYAVFGQADYDVTDRLSLIGGLRWSADEKRIDYTSYAEYRSIVLLQEQESRTFSGWSARAGIAYKLTPEARVYATYNRGYKSGGFFGGQATDASQLEPYDNETLNAYEVGVKTEMLGRRLRVNLSGFYYDYSNQQVFSQEVRNGVTTQILKNAASSRLYGAEFEVAGNVAHNLGINVSASYLHTEILDFISAGEDYSGNTLQQSPELSLTGSVNYTYDLPGGSAIVANADANYRTRVYFDNTQRTRLSDAPVTVIGAQLGWRSKEGRIELGAFVKNLLDKTYILGISAIDSLGIDGVNYAPPRVAGVYLRTRL